MKLLLGLLVGLFVVGCAGKTTRPTGTAATGPSQAGGWFCQMHPDGTRWDCVQDTELARNPRPERLPAAPTPGDGVTGGVPDPTEDDTDGMPPASAPMPATPPTASPPAENAQEQSAAPAEPAEPAEPAAPAAPAEPAEPVTAADTGSPDYVRLAYRPPQPVALKDLPADYYALQVLATTTRQAMDTFVDRAGFQEVSAARVEREGGIYYVLLLGIYETKALALQAARKLPPPLASVRPWVRSLGSLQAAMIRADEISNAEALAGALDG